MKHLLSLVRRLLFIALALWMKTPEAFGFLVAQPDKLDQLEGKVDAIFKGTVVADEPLDDAHFPAEKDFTVRETKFKVISMLKGTNPGETLRFRHYDRQKEAFMSMNPEPQAYHFKVGVTYLVCASKTEAAGVFQPFFKNPTTNPDFGMFGCADDQPVAGHLKEIVWREMTSMLHSDKAERLIYAIWELEAMSGQRFTFGASQDFDRAEVAKVVGPLITYEKPEVALAAIRIVGSGNPYMSAVSSPFWLGTIGAVENPGLGQLDPKVKNAGGELFQNDLRTIADGQAPVGVRALAIRALGFVGNPALAEPALDWTRNPEPAIRASAALLLADFAAEKVSKRLVELAADPTPAVRANAAYAIGFKQLVSLAETLGKLLQDPDKSVRFVASQSLLSFSPKDEAIAAVFRQNADNEEFYPLFLIALARENPEAYLEPISKVVEGRATPKNWQGGQVPSLTAFNILFKYLETRPVAEVRAGKFDRQLDALEKAYWTGSSEPRDIYAFFVQRQLTERAKAYRAAAKKAANFDLDYYFNMVDQSSSNYTR